MKNQKEVNEKVMALDLNHLTEDEILWLHTLKNKAQSINTAMFYKELGITKEARS